MTEIVPPNLINKLGHNILEIRERALLTLLSKIDNGFIFENELAQSKEILKKLFEWFLFNPCPHEEMVLALIKRIFLTDGGATLITHYGPNTIRKELKQVQGCLEPKYHLAIEELFEIINNFKDNIEKIPLLESDIPLSYRSDQSNKSKNFEGYISESPSVEPQQENLAENESTTLSTFSLDRMSQHQIHENFNCLEDILPYYTFQWQPLIDTDKHVLNSVENSLENPNETSDLIHTCEFFTDVLLKDFFGEIFLQRPKIVHSLQNLLTTSTSSKLKVALLNCFLNLTKSILRRIDHSNDPCMRSLKVLITTPQCSSQNSVISPTNESVQFKEDSNNLKEYEISTPEYCLKTLKLILDFLMIRQDTTKKEYLSLYNALVLIESLLHLLKRCVNQKIWSVQPHGIFYDVMKNLNECLKSFGDLLENYRFEIQKNELNAKFRAVQLCLLHHCMYLIENIIPLNKSVNILPKFLKNTLAMTLLDVSISKLYPEVYGKILEYVKVENDSGNSDYLKKYFIVQEICDSMTAAIKFMRQYESLSFDVLMNLAKSAIISLQFHENLLFVKTVIEACAKKFNLSTKVEDALQMEDVLLTLLSHHLVDVVKYAYELCNKKIISAIGPHLNLDEGGVSSAQVLFLLRSKIIIEIAEFGLSNKDSEIRKYSENIILHIIKCKILVPDEIWDKVKEGIIPAFPILLLFASKLSPLGRTLINVVEPDIAKDLKIKLIDVLKSNALLLFSSEDHVREEAYSRLCWLLTLQENSKNLLPRLNNIHDKTLPNVCLLGQQVFNVNKSKSNERFYQPSSLYHVMELMNSKNVEPTIRRSALTQIAVMMEDYLLHEIFIEKGGIQSVIDIMKSSLIEDNYMNFSDSVIPAVSILKNLCLYSSNVRYELSHDVNIYHIILRSMFLFFNDERMKIDSSVLLFLLLYSSFIQGSPSRANMALPKIVYQKLVTPLKCDVYQEISTYSTNDISKYIYSDECCKTSLQIHWNSEVYGGFQELTKLPNIKPPSDIKINDQLKLQLRDLNQVKISSVHFSIQECLEEMQKVESFPRSEDIINSLIIYFHLYKLGKKEDDGSILKFPWEEHFSKYLKLLPSSEEDANLLRNVIKFLRILVCFYKSFEKKSWIITFLKDPTNYITDVISFDNSTEEHLKILSRELISLITECVCQEQHLMDSYIEGAFQTNSSTEWAGVIELITDNLKFQDPKQLYNLAHLDSLLSCLVHLSAILGWSKAKRKGKINQTTKEIIAGLCDLVDAFHYGKGPTAAVSLIGLSVTRNVMLILNHILAEMFNSKTKNWDQLFIDDFSEENKIFNFVTLWDTRDVILKAAVLQFFAGLVKSTRLSRDIILDLKKKNQCLWRMTLNVLLDIEEASIVREYAALILANLCTHRSITNNNQQNLHKELIPLGYDDKYSTNPVESILKLFDEKEGIKYFKALILCLYTNNLSDSMKLPEKSEIETNSFEHLYTFRSESDISEKSWNSNDKKLQQAMNIVTPSLIKSSLIFLHNLIEMTEKSFIDYLNETGLIKLIFRAICIPSIEIRNTKELSLYIELLEMNSEICFFLNRAVRSSAGCLGTVLHTKDCLNILISLLNPKIYYTHFSQLLFLRNKLWTEIFDLIGTMLECGCQIDNPMRAFEILGIILETVYSCDPKNLVTTICEAIGNFKDTELQNSVLQALTLMLQIECSFLSLSKKSESKNDLVLKHSMKNFLDVVEAPEEGIEKEKSQGSNHSLGTKALKYKMNLLERIYFGENFSTNISIKPKDDDMTPPKKDKIIFGAEICKILLHLYDIYDLKSEKDCFQKQTILAATSGILCVSSEAKYYALSSGFLQKVINSLKELTIKLSLESVDCFRRVGDKKRISPLIKDLDCITGLLTNFLLDNVSVKCEASCLGLADIIHKVWNWFCLHKSSLINVLKMLSTFTTNCPFACQTLPFTSSVAGTGPRKTASSVSLLHEIISKILKEMEMLSKTHDILPLELCFNILINCSPALECRICVTKSSLLQGMLKIHPAITKRQKPWESVELIWLEFIQIFTVYPEGQMYIGKVSEILDLILILTQSSRIQNRQAALTILQNLAFYTLNRARLLTTSNFINVLTSKLQFGSNKEKVIVVNIMWALAANNSKAKTIFKSAKLDLLLNEAIKKIQLLDDNSLSDGEIDRMKYVFDILNDKENCK